MRKVDLVVVGCGFPVVGKLGLDGMNGCVGWLCVCTEQRCVVGGGLCNFTYEIPIRKSSISIVVDYRQLTCAKRSTKEKSTS